MNWRSLAVFVFDLLVLGLSWGAAHWLRLGFDLPEAALLSALRHLVWIVPIYALLFWRFGLYRGIWRFASLSDLQRIVLSVGMGALIVAAGVALAGLSALPRSVLVLHPLFALLAMGGCRFLYRSWKEYHLYGPGRWASKPILVVGSGEEAQGLLRELHNSRDWHAVGLVDDHPESRGRRMLGVPIVGPVSRIAELAGQLGTTNVLIAMPTAKPELRRKAAENAVQAGLNVLTVPAFTDLMSGRVSISHLRKIELEDLLGREPVQLDDAGLEGFIGGRVVMVTGAGGSIGSELLRQIVRYRPSLLLLVELSEFALYQIEQELLRDHAEIPLVCLVADVRQAERMDEILERFQPELVFHAAAYKHVPLMESDNAWEAVRNNVLGTLVLARAAVAHGVKKFVLVSTDKAVNPSSVMGASKRMAEMVCKSLQAQDRTSFVTVRFGNVLGSTGSVIPKFKEQIARGGPVTVTHPEMTRYFMLIPEAAQLVLQAACMGNGGEIFVLDMGQPVRIVDLARDMIRLSGYSESEIKIAFTGLRPGEKLYEELLADNEHTVATSHPKVRIALAREVPPDWLAQVEQCLAARVVRDLKEVKRDLRRWIPEYQPPSPLLSLVAPAAGERRDVGT